ncbi:CLUMA_CG004228, isoform A [Clunio marinus]|uniref:CLUMA_CG004228, isoform A n=1 Tax=Clunio marinus TaxID=568069 RepID=A0A1J1HSR0_9DIPT|nr:CLUMA_CG004228, isoform A [Clunio marinus]
MEKFRICPSGTYHDPLKDRCRLVPGGGNLIKFNLDAKCSRGFIGLLAHSRNSRYYYVCQRNAVLTCKCKTKERFNRMNLRCERKGRRRSSKERHSHAIVENILEKYKCIENSGISQGSSQYSQSFEEPITFRSVEMEKNEQFDLFHNLLKEIQRKQQELKSTEESQNSSDQQNIIQKNRNKESLEQQKQTFTKLDESTSSTIEINSQRLTEKVETSSKFSTPRLWSTFFVSPTSKPLIESELIDPRKLQVSTTEKSFTVIESIEAQRTNKQTVNPVDETSQMFGKSLAPITFENNANELAESMGRSEKETEKETLKSTLKPESVDRVLDEFVKRNLTITSIKGKRPDRFNKNNTFDYDFEDEFAKTEQRKKFVEYYELIEYYYEDEPNVTLWTKEGETTIIVEFDETTLPTTVESLQATGNESNELAIEITTEISENNFADIDSSASESKTVEIFDEHPQFVHQRSESLVTLKSVNGNAAIELTTEASTDKTTSDYSEDVQSTIIDSTTSGITLDTTTFETTDTISTTFETSTSLSDSNFERLIITNLPSTLLETTTEDIDKTKEMTTTTESYDTTTIEVTTHQNQLLNYKSDKFLRNFDKRKNNEVVDITSTTDVISTKITEANIEVSTTDLPQSTIIESTTEKFDASTMETFYESTTEKFDGSTTERFYESTTENFDESTLETSIMTLSPDTKTTPVDEVIDVLKGKGLESTTDKYNSDETTTTNNEAASIPTTESTSLDLDTTELTTEVYSTTLNKEFVEPSFTVIPSVVKGRNDFHSDYQEQEVDFKEISTTTESEISTTVTETTTDNGSTIDVNDYSTESEISTTLTETTTDNGSTIVNDYDQSTVNNEDSETFATLSSESTTDSYTSTMITIDETYEKAEDLYTINNNDFPLITSTSSATENDIETSTLTQNVETTTLTQEIETTTNSSPLQTLLGRSEDFNEKEVSVHELPKKEYEYYYVYEEYYVDDPTEIINQTKTDNNSKNNNSNIQKVWQKQKRDNSFEYYVESLSASREYRKNIAK